MSYLSDASLVMIPSGVEAGTVFTSKPAGGSADLTFTRSNDTATRVGPNGYIEKVRTNVLLQSNQFDTTWTGVNATLTSGQSGYDGTNNAWELEATNTASNTRVDQSISISGVNTFSIYAKAGTSDWMRMNIITTGVSNANNYYDISNGVKGSSPSGSVIADKIESVGNGWYRISLLTEAIITEVRVQVASNDEDSSVTSGDNIYIQAAQLEAGDIATDYIPTTTAAVSVGPVANVPRINFDPVLPRTGSLLLEPQRTNLVTYSEYFSSHNLVNVSSTENATTSPEGVDNAAEIIEASGFSEHMGYLDISCTTSTDYTISIFAKANTRNYFLLRFGAAGGVFTNSYAWFDLSNGTKGTVESGITADIEDYGNGWYRLTATRTSVTTAFGRFFWGLADANGSIYYTGDGTSSAYTYGFQVEAGSYPTSYIPTYSVAATRGDDAASKTGISSVIGQTEGVIFIDVQTPSEIGANSTFSIGAGTSGEYAQLEIRTDLRINWRYRTGATDYINANKGSFTAGDRLKIAFAYKNLDSILYLNGSSIATDTGTIPANSWDEVRFSNYAGTNKLEAQVNKAILFPTRLTNDQLSQITTL